MGTEFMHTLSYAVLMEIPFRFNMRVVLPFRSAKHDCLGGDLLFGVFFFFFSFMSSWI